MSEIPKPSAALKKSAIPARQRRRLEQGKLETGEDIVALRRLVGLSQIRFAQALGMSVHTLRNWEQGRRQPEGPALALLRIAARYPGILLELGDGGQAAPERPEQKWTGRKRSWRTLSFQGTTAVARVAAVFEVGPPLPDPLPFASFTVKVLERRDGEFAAHLNVAVRREGGYPDPVAGLGDTPDEALADALEYFWKAVQERGASREEDFVWADAPEW